MAPTRTSTGCAPGSTRRGTRRLGRGPSRHRRPRSLSILIVAILVSYVGMVYGPIGAFLAEYFPARIRYSSVSVPYHIGNGWGGGLVPVITTAAYVTAQTAGLS